MEKFKSWNDVRSELFTPEEIAEQAGITRCKYYSYHDDFHPTC